ncbi:unnamed protein product [Caenorhabditis sp. 36 PRJEB53466]|nr:unnamed protein product [Caenorhabditis sp. 36 PRJEB53466]
MTSISKWHRLTDELKTKFLELTDYESRRNLMCCSKELNRLVSLLRYEYVRLLRIKIYEDTWIFVLESKQTGSDAVSTREDPKNDGDWRRILDQFLDFLITKEIEEVRLNYPIGTEIFVPFHWVQTPTDQKQSLYKMENGNNVVCKVVPTGLYCRIVASEACELVPTLLEHVVCNNFYEYEEKSMKNWCDLPPELKLVCIQHMNYRTRCLLRATARLEMSLVEKLPFNFHAAHFHHSFLSSQHSNYISMVVDAAGEKIDINTNPFKATGLDIQYEQSVAAIRLMMRLCSFKLLRIFSYEDFADVTFLLAELSKSAPFHVRNVVLECAQHELAAFFLKNCKKELNIVELYFQRSPKVTTGGFIKLLESVNARHVQMTPALHSENVISLIWMIERWIEMDAPIGRRFLLNIRNESFENLLMSFAERFYEQIEYQNYHEVRLYLDEDEEKAILVAAYPESRTISCLVIPSTLDEDDYETSDGWIDDLTQ